MFHLQESLPFGRINLFDNMMEVELIRRKFPILERSVAGKPLVYLDNTATSQAPMEVVREIERIYTGFRANVHRGVHTLSQEMTGLQENCRERVREFINASSIEEIIFTRGTTESINLVANSFGSSFKAGDEVILTVMEHHANIVPWQLLRDRTGIVLKVVDIDEMVTCLNDEKITLEQLKESLTQLDKLLQIIYAGEFDKLTHYISDLEM